MKEQSIFCRRNYRSSDQLRNADVGNRERAAQQIGMSKRRVNRAGGPSVLEGAAAALACSRYRLGLSDAGGPVTGWIPLVLALAQVRPQSTMLSVDFSNLCQRLR
jgi:hypothetical protein